MRAHLIAAAVLALPLVAHGAAVPQGTVLDPRVTRVPYDARDVVVIEAAPGYVSRIVLAPGDSVCESCTRTGFPAGWEIVPQGDMIDIRPVEVEASDGSVREPDARTWATNLVVRTDARRFYTFELRLAATAAAAAYHVEVTDPAAEIARELAARRDALDRAEAESLVAALPRPTNTDYRAAIGRHGAPIRPSAAWDDGQRTYLRFPGEIPAVFVVGADGGERTANVEPDPERPDVMVVDRLAPRLVLRLGRAVVTVINGGSAIAPPNPARPALRGAPEHS